MLKTATTILIVVMIFAGLYGTFLIVSPETVASGTLEARSGKAFELVEDQDVAKVKQYVQLARFFHIVQVPVSAPVFSPVFLQIHVNQWNILHKMNS